MKQPLQRFSAMSVLIVDDNPANVALLAALVEDAGLHRITTVTDSREVAGLLPEVSPDLVLLDLHMPHLDGHHILEQITQFAAGTYLPVLVLTADTTSIARDRALARGARDFLTKPFDDREAELRIANLLETRQLHNAMRRTSDRVIRHAGNSSIALQLTETRIQGVLRNATALAPVFQPVVDLSTAHVVGYEALSRFSQPHVQGPAGWFSDAHEVGLGIDLEWLAALRALESISAVNTDCFLSVNLSPASVLALEQQALCDTGLCHRIVIELTEHVPVEDYGALHRALAHMREHGTRLAADDLGAGYAGFRHLVSLEPDIIKLDISLVQGLQRSRGQRALATALLAFAADMGATVIAEGVEDATDLAVLRELGVPWGQGYLLGRPQPLT